MLKLPLILLRTIVYFVPAVLARMCRIRVVQISTPGRIGHLALEPDSYAKDRILSGRRETSVLAVMEREVANTALLEHWRKHYVVVRHPFLVSLLRPLQKFRLSGRYLGPYAIAINETAECYGASRRWGHRPPLLALSEAERIAGWERLARMGVPAGAWFVCVHSREGGYSRHDEHWHSYRNSAIADYIPAMEAIVAVGGWCIRMGDPTMETLPPITGVIDYASSPDRSPAMDVFLAAECRFLIGNSSGVAMLPLALGRPSALANQAPLSATYAVGPNDLAIPKLVKREGKVLPLADLFASPAANYRFTELYEKDGLELVGNTPTQIRALAVEMLERLNGKAVYTTDDEERQSRFQALFRPGHYSYGAPSRIGRDFLRSLDDPSLGFAAPQSECLEV